MVKNLLANAGDTRDTGLIPGLGRSPGGGHGNPFQYSCLENPMDRGAWQLQSIGSQTFRNDKQFSMHTHRTINWDYSGLYIANHFSLSACERLLKWRLNYLCLMCLPTATYFLFFKLLQINLLASQQHSLILLCWVGRGATYGNLDFRETAGIKMLNIACHLE